MQWKMHRPYLRRLEEGKEGQYSCNAIDSLNLNILTENGVQNAAAVQVYPAWSEPLKYSLRMADTL